jgi:hypothetical protein
MTADRGWRCDKCRYFATEKEREDQGYCRRRAPVPSLVGPLLLDADDHPRAVWPRVHDSDWCGEFSLSPVLLES